MSFQEFQDKVGCFFRNINYDNYIKDKSIDEINKIIDLHEDKINELYKKIQEVKERSNKTYKEVLILGKIYNKTNKKHIKLRKSRLKDYQNINELYIIEKNTYEGYINDIKHYKKQILSYKKKYAEQEKIEIQIKSKR